MNFLSLDVGTTCCKCQLFSKTGEILFYKSEEYPYKVIDGVRYVDIDDLWRRVRELIAHAAAEATVSSVCVSSFGESFVLLDRQDAVLMPPMLYTDPRGEVEAQQARAQFGTQAMFERTGTLPQSLYSVYKLLWIKRHAPDVYARADKVMLICDYIGYRLTGERVIDYGLATRTGAFDVGAKRFDQTLLTEMGIEPSLFSEPKCAGSIVGAIKGDLCKELGLPQDCTLVLGSHDQICTALGAGVVSAGNAVDGMGTVECITAVFDHRPTDVKMGEAGYVVVPYAIDGLYCTYLFNFSCGGLVNWYRRDIMHDYCGEEDSFFQYMDRLLDDEPSGILTLPYFSGAATPYQNINARGAMINLAVDSSDADVYRSILEGTAMEMRLNVQVAAAFGISLERAVATGGGANADKWLQIKADIQNIPFYTLRSSEGGLCGCAMLQAVALGAESDLEAAAKRFVVYNKEFSPKRHDVYEAQYQKYEKIYQIVKELY